MKFIISVLLTALLSFAGGLYLAWWSIAIVAFVVSLIIPQGSGRSFLGGFLAIFILWGSLAWWIDYKNGSILSRKMAEILPLGGSTFSIIILTAFVGALVAGFAALAGNYLKKAIRGV